MAWDVKFSPESPQGQTGVIKLNFFYFAMYMQKYCLTSSETSLNYSSGLFKPRDVAFCPLLALHGIF